MKQWTKAEKDSATLSFVLNYKPVGMKEVICPPITIRVKDLSDEQYKTIMNIIGGKKAYKSRKLVMKLNKETNEEQRQKPRSTS